jgi:hypothetical protein
MRTEQPARPHSILSPQTFSGRFALLVSLILHPFVVSPATILVLAGRSTAFAFTLAIVIPMFVLITLRVRRGHWTNYDVSVRTHRGGLYWPALILTLLAALAIHLRGDNPGLARGFIVAAAMIAAAMVANRFLKLSLHMTFAAFSAVAIGWTYPVSLPVIIALLVLLAWSRLKLARHTWAEVVAGTVLGLAAGWVLVAM